MKTHVKNSEVRLASAEDKMEIAFHIVKGLNRMPDAIAKRILGSKTEFQKLVQRFAKDLEIPIVDEYVMRQIALLVDFYKQVLDSDKSEIAELAYPQHETFKTFMVGGVAMDEDQIMEAYAKKWGINLYRYMKPAASKIDRKSEQKRPNGLYVFAHCGGDEPDQAHLGKSYDDAMAANMIFMNSREYLLATGFHRFTRECFMDVKGWTRTSSLWSDGRLVNGYWDSDDSKLYLRYGNRDYRNSGYGPRELIFS
jgi:uncharacterized protein YktA (UPF0223 family)